MARKYLSRGIDARQREIAILREVQDLGDRDPEHREALVTELIRVGEWENQAKAFAWRWRSGGIAKEDITHAAIEGLLEAVKRFDSGKLIDGKGWISYAHLWMRLRVMELARKQGAIVAESAGEIQAELRVRRALTSRPDASDEDLRTSCNLSAEAVARARQGRRASYSPRFGTRRHERALIADVESRDRTETIDRQVAVAAALAKMSPVARRLVMESMGADDLLAEDAEAQAVVPPKSKAARRFILEGALDSLRQELGEAMYGV